MEPITPKDYGPWVQAETLDDLHLFWMPVSCFPIPHEQRNWVQKFAELWSEALKTMSLREEVFLGFPTIVSHLNERFTTYSYKSPSLPGIGRKPGQQLQGIPDTKAVQDEVAKTGAMDMANWTADYAMWFQMKQARRQYELFSGYGGLTTIYLPPDQKTSAPPLMFTPKFRAAMPVFQPSTLTA